MTTTVTDVQEFTPEQRDEMSHAFDRGNYANAYESTDLDDHDLDPLSAHERAAWVLGFFGSYSLDEIGSDRETFDEAYHSPAGQYVVKVARYTDDRADEYAAESGDDDEPTCTWGLEDDRCGNPATRHGRCSRHIPEE